MADQLFVTVATVRTHLARIRSKYREVGRPRGTKIALLIRAVEDGYCTLDDIADKPRLRGAGRGRLRPIRPLR